MYTVVTILWISFNMTGTATLLLLLGTFYFVPSLPQRKNPFLINLHLSTLLATVAANLLFITGQQERITIFPICLVQSILMDAVGPVVSTSMSCLVFQLWDEISSAIKGKVRILERSNVARRTVLIAPYVTLVIWITFSIIVTTRPPIRVLPLSFSVCLDRGPTHHTTARIYVGPFMVACGLWTVCFEVWTAYLLVTRKSPRELWDVEGPSFHSYRMNLYLAMRVFIFNLIQIVALFLTAANRVGRSEKKALKTDDVGQILESTLGLAVFVAFGTQRTVLEAWKIVLTRDNRPTSTMDNPDV